MRMGCEGLRPPGTGGFGDLSDAEGPRLCEGWLGPHRGEGSLFLTARQPAPRPGPITSPTGLGHLRDGQVTSRGQRFGAAEVEVAPCCLWSSLPAVWQC